MRPPRLLTATGAVALLALAFLLGRWSTAHRATNVSPTPTSAQATPSANKTDSAVAAQAPGEAASRAARLAQAAAVAPSSLAEEEERERTIEAWAALDPRAAMEFARTQLKGDRRAQAMAAVITAWGKSNPDEAWAWVSTVMPTATHYFDSLLEVFGRSSTDTAARYAASFAASHPAAALEVHLAALLGITYRGDFAGARALVDGNPTLAPELRANLENFIAGQWARFAPEQAAAWVMTLPAGALREQALIGLGESWSDVDPAHAAAFAVDLPAGTARTLALRQAIGKWVVADPDAARDWVITSNHHEDFDQAVQTIATDPNLVNRQPGRALKWAATIFDDRLRAESVGTILHNWYPADPAGATAYIQSCADFTPQQRSDLIAKLQSSRSNPGG